MNLRVNPYIAGAPLRGEKGFYGRQDMLEWVQRELRNPETNALVLFGQRRIGKTTLLLQLARSLPQDEFLPIYFDLQDQAARPLGQTLGDIAEILCEKSNLDLAPLHPFDDQGRSFEKEFLPRFYAALGEKRRPVFLLDEFDVLDQTVEAALAETATAKTLFPLLRRLMINDGRSAFIFVVGRRSEDLSIDFSTTFKASLVREIWALDQRSAQALVRQAQTNGTLSFTEDAVQRILNLTSYHPYLTQLLCQRIWELAHAAGPSTVPTIGIKDVENAVESSLEAGNHALEWLWNGLNPAEKVYASALAEIAGENEIIPEEHIIEVLTTHAARLRTHEVELAPRDLVRRHIIDVGGERGYRFAVELFRRWVHKNKPLIFVKDEIDRIVPMADRLFQFGKSFYDARQWERAANYFREALNVNPRHFRARLYLGEILLEQGQVDESLAELEQALALDREEARLPLARARLSKAESLKAEDELDLRFRAYARVLELSPNESQAILGRLDVWRQRARIAEEKDDLPAAIEAYLQAGDQESVERLSNIRRERTLAELEGQARQHIKARRWEAARSVYVQLVELASDDARRLHWQSELEKAQAQVVEQGMLSAQAYEQRGEWEKAARIYEDLTQIDGQDAWKTLLENARHQQEMAALFEQGRQALQQEDWEKAQQFFAQLAQIDPDYNHNGMRAVRLRQDALQHRRDRSSHQLARWAHNFRRTLSRWGPALVSGLGWGLGWTLLFLIAEDIFSSYVPNFFMGLVPAIFVATGIVLSIKMAAVHTISSISLVQLFLLCLVGMTNAFLWIFQPGDPDLGFIGMVILMVSVLAGIAFLLRASIPSLRWKSILGGWVLGLIGGIITFLPFAALSSFGIARQFSVLGPVAFGFAAFIVGTVGAYQTNREIHRAALPPLLIPRSSNSVSALVLTALVLAHSALGAGNLYRFSQKPLKTGDVITDIPLSREVITVSNASQIGEFGYLNAHTYATAFSSGTGLFAASFYFEDYVSNYRCTAIMQIETGMILQTLYDHASEIRSLDFSPDGSLLVTGLKNGILKIWNVQTGELVRSLEGHTGSVHEDFSPDGSLLVSVGYDNIVLLWQVSDGSLLRTLEGHTDRVNSVVFSPDGSLLASAGEDHTVRLWQVSNGSLLHTLEGNTAGIYTTWDNNVIFSPDGSLLAWAGGDNTVRLWQVSDGSLLYTLQGSAPIFSPDGSLVASSVDDGTVRVWQVSDGSLLRTLEGHTNEVTSIDFSPDGSLLASGYEDGTVRLWQVSDGTLLTTVSPHSRVVHLEFSPDGGLLLVEEAYRIAFWGIRGKS